MDVTQIRELARIMSEYGLAEITLAEQDVRIGMRAMGDQGTRVQLTSEGALAPESLLHGRPSTDVAMAAAPEVNYVDVSSPMVGVFYVAPSPGAEPFVRLGEEVAAGQVMCIVEAMKMMNEITATADGVVREVLVENAMPVEFGQTLFRIEPY